MIHLLEAQQFTPELLFSLFHQADSLRIHAPQSLKGKIIATLFYEPSTRTRLSFEAAMMRLGGRIITTENAREFSSAVKGESIEDTARVVGSYVDGIVLRHYEEGAAQRASTVSPVPVINAGDGKGQHPTQALLDVYTIYSEIGRLRDFTIALVGDLQSGRTVRSLCYLLGKLGESNIRIIFVSPDHLRMGDDVKAYLEKHSVSFREEPDLERVLPAVDIVYMTRVQRERMDAASYEKARGRYAITENNIHLLRPEARILHPLPHVEELSLSIEREQNDPRVAYFRQSENGLYIRMALLQHVLGK
jgi:aspartate carbamoyltransferase catalytic subunit